ncbi:MAG: sulfotransferase family 2 domain-containing protein [Syntrophobacteraceae bacterium]
MEPTNILIFLHIPKTAGITLESIFKREYGKKRTIAIDKGNFEKALSELGNETLGSRQKSILINARHSAFGIHRLIPSPSTYITILRDPITRVVSYYYYLLAQKDNSMRDIVVSRHMSLEEFVTSGITFNTDNGQTRQLAGAYDVPFGQCTDGLLSQALDNIDNHFSFVGLTESFDHSLIRMREIYGWRKHPVYIKRNKNKKKPFLTTIPDRTIEIIREHNDLDCRLYDYVKSSFEKTGSVELTDKIRHFQRIKWVYCAIKKPIALQNSLHRPIVKKLETFIKSHRTINL